MSPRGRLSVIDARQARGEDPQERLARERHWADAIRTGDEAAFEALFRAYYARLCAFTEGYVTSPEMAEEIVADVFVRIWERRADWDIRDSVRSYLYTAVRNRALTQGEHERVVRHAHARAVREDLHLAMGQPPVAADTALQTGELADLVAHAIAQLPERGREAFVLHRQHGFSYTEVGRAMGIAPRTVEVHIRRALKALRDSLGGYLSR